MFIIGGGTSLEAVTTDMELMTALLSKRSIGCNKSALLFNCNYMAFMDKPFGDRYHEIINKFQEGGGVVFAPPFTVKPPKLSNINYVTSSTEPSACFEKGVYYGNNSGVFALCLAVAMGAEEVYLCGIDCRYNKDMTASHFHDGYGTALNQSNEDKYTTMIKYFMKTGKYLTKAHPDVKLFIVTNEIEDSLVDLDELYYKRISYKDALK